jgi:hypothetical protein
MPPEHRPPVAARRETGELMSEEQNGSKAGTPSPARLGSEMAMAAVKLRSAVGMNITVRTRGMTQRQIDYCWEVIDIIEKHFPNTGGKARLNDRQTGRTTRL